MIEVRSKFTYVCLLHTKSATNALIKSNVNETQPKFTYVSIFTNRHLIEHCSLWLYVASMYRMLENATAIVADSL